MAPMGRGAAGHSGASGHGIASDDCRPCERADPGGRSQRPDRPRVAERASPVPFAGPRRVSPPGIAFEALPPIDAVLLSHNHYDHMDLPTLRRLNTKYHPLMV